MKRCPWTNLDQSDIYQRYHDEEWGVPSHDDRHLFEMLVLESFHCGLSWLIILKKREHFRNAFDQFDPVKISEYTEEKVDELMQNTKIVRNKRKIMATIQNAKAFLKTQNEYGCFAHYLWHFTKDQVQYATSDEAQKISALSDTVAKDLKKRGFAFMGSVTTFSYLEAVGIMNHHVSTCFLYQERSRDLLIEGKR